MVDREPTIVGIGVLIDKLVVAGRHVHCAGLDDKCIDTHGELGEHGDEHMVDLAGHHQNIRP